MTRAGSEKARPILCATDLSEASATVARAAAAMSRLFGAELELFHAVAPPPVAAPDMNGDQVIVELRAAAQTAIAVQAAGVAGDRPRTRVEIGSPAAIVERAREIGAALLVVGTHARHGAAHLLLGSVAERTLRTAPCPVLVVPPAAAGAVAGRGGTPNKFLKVVGGIDFSPASDSALAWLGGLRARIDCDVRLIHLYVPEVEHARLGFDPPLPFEVEPELVDALARELRPRVEALAGRGCALRIRPAWGGEEDPLAWEAETDDADLLIIGTSQARHSTALRTIRGAHLPVLCVPRAATAVAESPLAPIKVILVPTDFSPGGAAAVSEAYRLLLPAGGDVVLAHVGHPDGLGLDPGRQEEIENCLLALIPENVHAPHIRARTLVMVDAAPGEAIVKAVRRIGADLVVMAARGKTGGRNGHGMVTDHVVWNAPRPVVVVPGPARPLDS